MTNITKEFHSSEFNFRFNSSNGYTEVWGVTEEHDPEFAPFPLIADMEITTSCNGIGDYGPCPFCYKSNTKNGTYMPFTLARRIIDKFPEHLTQIAFGTDAKLESNPDWYKIFSYTKRKGIIPNVTVADINQKTADMLASVCGAVAVSRYFDADICYNSIKRLTDAGLKQVNMHILLSMETLQLIYRTIFDLDRDPRLEKLNAIVLLSLKRKGRGINYHPVPKEGFNQLMDILLDGKHSFGFDSCIAHKVLDYIEEKGPEYAFLKRYCTPCESTRESCYINVNGQFFPCSFVQGTPGWEHGIDITRVNDFINDVWYNPRVCLFRERLLMGGCHCPIYNV